VGGGGGGGYGNDDDRRGYGGCGFGYLLTLLEGGATLNVSRCCCMLEQVNCLDYAAPHDAPTQQQ
jgi:hypothetical protein